MQAHQPQGGAEKATTPTADLRLVSVEQLQKIHRELDACQKVIWLAGCGQRGYGFDPSYVTGAQEQLKEIEALIASAATVAPAAQVPEWISVSARLPECLHECTTDETMVSHTVLVTDEHDLASLGLGHMRADGTWKLYGGDYDFMSPDPVTHWMPLPAAVKPVAKGGE